MSGSSSEREVVATRAQMELARHLGLAFAADHQSREHAQAEHGAHLVPGLPDPDGLVTVEMVLSVETLLSLVETIRTANGSASGQ
jgi:hypothetical protein